MMILGCVALLVGVIASFFITVFSMPALSLCPTQTQYACWWIIIFGNILIWIVVPAFGYSGIVINGVII